MAEERRQEGLRLRRDSLERGEHATAALGRCSRHAFGGSCCRPPPGLEGIHPQGPLRCQKIGTRRRCGRLHAPSRQRCARRDVAGGELLLERVRGRKLVPFPEASRARGSRVRFREIYRVTAGQAPRIGYRIRSETTGERHSEGKPPHSRTTESRSVIGSRAVSRWFHRTERVVILAGAVGTCRTSRLLVVFVAASSRSNGFGSGSHTTSR